MAYFAANLDVRKKSSNWQGFDIEVVFTKVL